MEGVKRGDFDKVKKEINKVKPAKDEYLWGELRNENQFSLISTDKT
jgi:hypothetical protein